jgi:hypothetical protein
LCNLYSVTKGQHAIRELAGAMRDRDFTLRTLVTPGSDFFPLRTNTGDGMPQRAYLDVTENLKGIASATEIAEHIRAKIRRETNLTTSAGVSYNKFLAKLASDHRKPDGLFVITPKMGPAFVENLPVARFHGVGPATTAK